MSELYDYYKSHGICVDCGQENAKRGYVRCWRCLINRRELQAERKAEWSDEKRNAINKQSNEWWANARKERKENGLCPRCGGERKDKKFVMCEKCRAKHNRQRANKRRENGVLSDDLRGDGLFCNVCLKPVEHEGDKLCGRCKANSVRTIAVARSARNTADHPWRQLSNGQYKLYMAKKKWEEEHGDREGV